MAEPFGQRLWLLFAALSAYHVGPYNSKPLPCTKNPQTAAKIISKGQQTLESYQQLIQLDSDNARWWLGVAIQQERALQLKDAKVSYQMALQKMGISSQSQRFIQERLKVLQELESVQ
ncbi:hypothetical protein BOO35_08440 [Vibrio navarrensis]|uniref:hypothetical protein n=1 Tax=Vibrio navarrensis TaxID=29495 RepID=UPI001D80FDA6|nr:hypothetical protein [Vibrio navarrensis]